MQAVHEIKKELIFTKGVKSLISSKQEISVMRMQKIRNYVLQAREFTLGLSSITNDIRQAYSKQIDFLLSDGASINDLIKMSISVKKGAWVSVLITPNSRLAGTIVQKVYALFEQNLHQGAFSDIVIIGSLGKQLFESGKFKNRSFTYFELPENHIERKDLVGLISFLSNYAKIDVYYGKLQNLVYQDAVKTDITSETLFENENNNDQKPLSKPKDDTNSQNNMEEEPKYLFEPDYRQILQAMEVQFLTLFFKQVIDESQLAQLGSRINFMEEASDRIDGLIQKITFQEKQAQKAKQNRKQQETLSGMSLWN